MMLISSNVLAHPRWSLMGKALRPYAILAVGNARGVLQARLALPRPFRAGRSRFGRHWPEWKRARRRSGRLD